jgi:hypothetical protein
MVGHVARPSPQPVPVFNLAHKGLHTHRTFDDEQVDLNEKCRSAALLQSPLTDSNRRPLLTMRSKRQTVAAGGDGSVPNQADFGPSESRTFATGCAPSVP